jgi:hypothetical protein
MYSIASLDFDRVSITLNMQRVLNSRINCCRIPSQGKLVTGFTLYTSRVARSTSFGSRSQEEYVKDSSTVTCGE